MKCGLTDSVLLFFSAFLLPPEKELHIFKLDFIHVINIIIALLHLKSLFTPWNCLERPKESTYDWFRLAEEVFLLKWY